MSIITPKETRLYTYISKTRGSTKKVVIENRTFLFMAVLKNNKLSVTLILELFLNDSIQSKSKWFL